MLVAQAVQASCSSAAASPCPFSQPSTAPYPRPRPPACSHHAHPCRPVHIGWPSTLVLFSAQTLPRLSNTALHEALAHAARPNAVGTVEQRLTPSPVLGGLAACALLEQLASSALSSYRTSPAGPTSTTHPSRAKSCPLRMLPFALLPLGAAGWTTGPRRPEAQEYNNVRISADMSAALQYHLLRILRLWTLASLSTSYCGLLAALIFSLARDFHTSSPLLLFSQILGFAELSAETVDIGFLVSFPLFVPPASSAWLHSVSHIFLPCHTIARSLCLFFVHFPSAWIRKTRPPS